MSGIPYVSSAELELWISSENPIFLQITHSQQFPIIDRIMPMRNMIMVLIAFVAITVLLTSGSYSQAKNGENVITAGLGLGYPGAYGTMGMPPIFVSFDHGIQSKVSVGGVVSFSTSKYSFTTDDWSYTYIFVGARGAYHFGDLIKDNKDFDLYGGLTLGYHIVSSSFSGKDEKLHVYSPGAGYFGFGIFVGGRYYFSPKWAATAELGYDIGFLKIGISYKL